MKLNQRGSAAKTGRKTVSDSAMNVNTKISPKEPHHKDAVSKSSMKKAFFIA
jgi:hypothetical protein